MYIVIVGKEEEKRKEKRWHAFSQPGLSPSTTPPVFLSKAKYRCRRFLIRRASKSSRTTVRINNYESGQVEKGGL
jgi:hypothetical protein